MALCTSDIQEFFPAAYSHTLRKIWSHLQEEHNNADIEDDGRETREENKVERLVVVGATALPRAAAEAERPVVAAGTTVGGLTVGASRSALRAAA